MTTIAEKLHKWSLQELNLVSEGNLNKTPKIESFQKLTKGKNKNVWNYVINHVRSQATVNKVKRILLIKKQLKEQQNVSVYFKDESMDYEQLQSSFSKAAEKREYLMRSLSTIEERILDLDQNVQKTKDEIFKINQKTAVLEYLRKIYNEKNTNLKSLSSCISSYNVALNTYQTQTSKVFDKVLVDLSYDFLFKNKTVSDENFSRVKDLLNIISVIFKKQFNEEESNMKILTENFLNNIVELKNRGLLLTDLVMLLNEMSRTDLQRFSRLDSQNLSVKEYRHKKSLENITKSRFIQLKSDYVYNCLSAKKSKDEMENISAMKSRSSEIMMIKFKIHHSDLDYETKLSLFEKQAENEALIVSNNYLETYLRNVTSKTQTILKSIKQKKLYHDDLCSITQLFYKDTDLVFNLLDTSPSIIKKAFDQLNDLKLFASEELFNSFSAEQKDIERLKDCFSFERKQTWDYCTKFNLFELVLTESLAGNKLSVEDYQSLNIQPYQNITVLCEYWVGYKQKLRAEIAANAEENMSHNYNTNAFEVYSKIFKMLQRANFSLEKSMEALNYGTTTCYKNKSLIQEWWHQNAQYIPSIEYEGKTLKMWIDILAVLSDFELQSHT